MCQVATQPLQALAIEPTNACNLACSMCPSGKRPQGFISPDVFQNLILANTWIKRLSLNIWGESLLHPSLFQMIATARKILGPETTILFCTNGRLVSERLNELIRAELDILEFSAHARSEDISLFLKEKRSCVQVGLVLVINEHSTDIESFRSKWENRVDYIKLQPRITWDKSSHRTTCPEYFRGRLAIHWNGDISVCCADYCGALVIDNVGDGKYNLNMAWLGQEMSQLRHLVSEGKLPTFCQACNESSHPEAKRRF